MSPDVKLAMMNVANYTVMNEENYIGEELSNEIPPNETILWDAYVVQRALGLSDKSPVERFRLIGFNVTDDGATLYDDEVEA
jgi:hypothetical protein